MTNHHPTQHEPTTDKPTAKQQRYLRQLALQRGVSFTPPATRREASRLIDSLRQTRPEPASDRLRELRGVQADLATRRGDAASVREHELEGHGSSATWSQRT